MAIRYCAWTDVLAKFKLASEVVSVSGDQNRLIEEKTAIFRSFTRQIRLAALTKNASSEYEALARETVCNLVVGELERRSIATADELRDADLGFISGAFTEHELLAYAHIGAIRRGDAVFEEDPALRDVTFPDMQPAEANTSIGKVFGILPHEYKALVPGYFVVKCTTGGRQDDGTAKFSVFFQNEATAVLSALAATDMPTHVRNEFYISFRDSALTGAQYVVNDTWTCVVYPPNIAANNARGIKQLETFLG